MQGGGEGKNKVYRLRLPLGTPQKKIENTSEDEIIYWVRTRIRQPSAIKKMGRGGEGNKRKNTLIDSKCELEKIKGRNAREEKRSSTLKKPMVRSRRENLEKEKGT